MLTRAQERMIISLSTKKGRHTHGLCLVEGKKAIDMAGAYVEYSFTVKDSPRFYALVTTETPQSHAAVARIPVWTKEDIAKRDCIIILDGVQDPGNVGAIFRLALGFDASLALVESVDPASPKVIRSSAGAFFQVPWIHIKRDRIHENITYFSRPIFRLEKKKDAQNISRATLPLPLVLVVGSEGKGIQENIPGASLFISHNTALESLNVAHALAIVLYVIRRV
jgi:TrmH family RNA methyltransferase